MKAGPNQPGRLQPTAAAPSHRPHVAFPPAITLFQIMTQHRQLSPLLQDIDCTVFLDGVILCGPADNTLMFLSRAAGSREVDIPWKTDSILGTLPEAVRFECIAAIPASEMMPGGPEFPPGNHAWRNLTRRGLIHYLTAVSQRVPEAAAEIEPRISALLNPQRATSK